VIKTAALTATKFVNFNARRFQRPSVSTSVHLNQKAPLERVALFFLYPEQNLLFIPAKRRTCLNGVEQALCFERARL
jgi:hypothetical protein